MFYLLGNSNSYYSVVKCSDNGQDKASCSLLNFFYHYPYLLAVFGFVNISGSFFFFLQSSTTTLMLTKKETSNDTILQNLAWLHVTWWRQVYKRKSVGHLRNCDVVTQLLRCNIDVCLLLSCTGSVILSLICIHAVLPRGISRCSVLFYPLGEILKAVLVSESLTFVVHQYRQKKYYAHFWCIVNKISPSNGPLFNFWLKLASLLQCSVKFYHEDPFLPRHNRGPGFRLLVTGLMAYSQLHGNPINLTLSLCPSRLWELPSLFLPFQNVSTGAQTCSFPKYLLKKSCTMIGVHTSGCAP